MVFVPEFTFKIEILAVVTFAVATLTVVTLAETMLARVLTVRYVVLVPEFTFKIEILAVVTFAVAIFAVMTLALTRLVWVKTLRFPEATMLDTVSALDTARLVRRPTVVMLDWTGVASDPRIDPLRFEMP